MLSAITEISNLERSGLRCFCLINSPTQTPKSLSFTQQSRSHNIFPNHLKSPYTCCSLDLKQEHWKFVLFIYIYLQILGFGWVKLGIKFLGCLGLNKFHFKPSFQGITVFCDHLKFVLFKLWEISISFFDLEVNYISNLLASRVDWWTYTRRRKDIYILFSLI